MPAPYDEPTLLIFPFVGKRYSGLALTYECLFDVKLHNDPDAKPVTVWKKNDIVITSDDRLKVNPPMKQDGSSDTFRAMLNFEYLIADKDEGSYICENFVISSADSKFIKKGNSSLLAEPFSLSVKGTSYTLSTCMYMYMYLKQILISTNVKPL